MLQLFDSIRKRKARIAVMIVAALVLQSFGRVYGCPNGKGRGDRRGNLYTG